MVFIRVLGDFVCFGTCCKKYAVKGAVLAIWEVWGASWRVSWGRPGGCSGAAKGLLGASLVRLGASWGPPGGLLGPSLGPKKALGGLLKVPKTMVFTRVFGIFVFWAIFLQKI